MAFREKIAWLAFVSTILVWGGFFGVLFGVPEQGRGIGMIGPFIVATVVQAAGMAAGAGYWAARAPSEARAPADERERLLSFRATGVAYGVLVITMFAVIAWLHFGLHGPEVIFALVGAFVLAEAVRFGTVAIGYRLGLTG